MKLRLLAILLTLPLWACASKSDGTATSGSSAVSTALSVVETPLLIAFKVPLCLGAVPTMLPGAVASAVVPFKDQSKGNGGQVVANGVSDACGPPYIANPHY